MPKLWESQVIHSFFIPRYINNRWYWLRRGCYICRRYERIYYGKYPDRYFSEHWVNLGFVSKSDYINYKYNKIIPKKTELKPLKR